MSGIVNKVKDMMHKDKDTTHTDPAHSSHTGTHGTANPLDRNDDGAMNVRDLSGSGQHAGTGVGHSTGTHGTHGTSNPLDRNNDGRMNASDITGGAGSAGLGHSAAGHDSTGPHNTRTANVLDPHVGNTAGHGTHGTSNPLDRNNDGRMNAGDITGAGHSGVGHSTHGTSNPLDRNNDGRMNASDITGAGHSGVGGVGHSGAGLASSNAGTGIAGTSGGLGHSTGTHGAHGTSNPLDRNNDGRMNASDITGGAGYSGVGHSGAGTGGLTSHTQGGLEHRQGETGELPKALTEDVSRAENHGQAGHGHHTTEHAKPSLKDKLNPKVDADGDGKAGFMK